MKIVSLDLETTFTLKPKYGKTKEVTDYGSPYNEGNKVVVVGCYDVFTKEYKSFYMDKPNAKARLQEHLTKYDIMLGQNIKYDCQWLTAIGVNYSHLTLRDTMLREYLALCGNHKSTNLDALAEKYSGVKKLDVIKKYWAEGMNTDEIPAFILAEYLYNDCKNPAEIYLKQNNLPELKAQKAFHDYYHDLLKATIDMEVNGAKFDEDALIEVEQELDDNLAEKSHALYTIVKKVAADHPKVLDGSFNINSSEQMAQVIYSMELKRFDGDKEAAKANAEEWKGFVERFKPWAAGAQYELTKRIEEHFDPLPYGVGVKPDTKWLQSRNDLGAKGFSASSKTILSMLQHGSLNAKQKQLVGALQEQSKAATWKNSNLAGAINGVRDDGFIHGSFNMAVTSTRRFSSSEPNMQNWPREGTNPIKKLIKSRYEGGSIVNADYGQLEFRIVGMLAKDQQLLDDVLNGFDIHTHTAKLAFAKQWADNPETDAQKASNKALRQQAKTKTFEFQYGAFPKTKTERAIYDAFYGKYQGVAIWQEQVEDYVAAHQRYVCPYTGVIFKFEGANYNNKGMWLTKAKNYPVQFLAAVVTGCAMLNLRRHIASNPKIKLILSVHDSLVLDCRPNVLDETRQLVKTCMEQSTKVFENYFQKTLDVALDVDVSYGHNWYEQTEWSK